MHNFQRTNSNSRVKPECCELGSRFVFPFVHRRDKSSRVYSRSRYHQRINCRVFLENGSAGVSENKIGSELLRPDCVSVWRNFGESLCLFLAPSARNVLGRLKYIQEYKFAELVSQIDGTENKCSIIHLNMTLIYVHFHIQVN